MDGEHTGFAAGTGDRPRTLAEDYRRIGATQAVSVIVVFDDGSRVINHARFRYSKNYEHKEKGQGYDEKRPYGRVDIWWEER